MIDQRRVDEEAVRSFAEDLPFGLLAFAVEVFAGIGFIVSCIWLFI